MKLTGVTLSGIDETVNPYHLWCLRDDFPFVEFGVLRSKTRQGVEKRYPSPSWIKDNLLLGAYAEDFLLAFHLCGSFAREAMAWAVLHNDEFEKANRVQLNLSKEHFSVSNAAALDFAEKLNKTTILQVDDVVRVWRPADEYDAIILKNVQFLADASGGEGKVMSVPDEVPEGFRVGFAGGIGPDNVRGILEKLAAVKGGETWVDMESGVRTNDCFDVAKTKKVLEIAKEFI